MDTVLLNGAEFDGTRSTNIGSGPVWDFKVLIAAQAAVMCKKKKRQFSASVLTER